LRAKLSISVALGLACLCLQNTPAWAQSKVSPKASAPIADRWVGTWATSPVARPQPPSGATQPTPQAQPVPAIAGATLRQIIHISIGGSRVRVVFTNAFGNAPLSISAASIGKRDKESGIVEGSGHPVTFAGKASVIIPPGANMVSDPVAFVVPAAGDLAIDLYFPPDMIASTSPLTVHSGANQTNYISKPGNFTGAEFPLATTTASWFFLSRVDVTAASPVSAIIAFGDSITDGTRSTANTNHRWPDLLAARLATDKSANAKAMLNEAIAGNRLLSEANIPFGINALARFDRDVLPLPGATYMIVLEGINDIGMGRAGAAPSAEELIAAHQQLIKRAHDHGLKMIGATLTPFDGAAYFTADGEVKRKAINNWMRTGKGPDTYDGVIDFDQATRDPANPTKFNPTYDSGDHLHPNNAGYEAMAAAIDLKLFESAKRR
jgi:lysophospholipase L1-like esterase